MTEEHAGFLSDPHIWVLFSAIAFAVIVWKKGRQPLLNMLDSRTARIKADLEEAQRLKNEAQALLDSYQAKHRDAVQNAQKIIENAKETAAQIQKDAEHKLAEDMKRREALLLERIARAEAAAVRELRHQAADLAAAAAERMVTEAMDKRGSRLIDEAIEELPQRLKA
jgi:F-type H+-transporting ATPase subunit b